MRYGYTEVFEKFVEVRNRSNSKRYKGEGREKGREITGEGGEEKRQGGGEKRVTVFTSDNPFEAQL